jgi:protein-tyrosine phosphatase
MNLAAPEEAMLPIDVLPDCLALPTYGNAWRRSSARVASVLVHGAAGIGRTGLAAACPLVALGAEVDEAWRLSARPTSFRIETTGQLRFVGEFALAVRDAGLP